MPMTQPKGTEISMSTLQSWQMYSKGCLWQVTIHFCYTFTTRLQHDLRRPLKYRATPSEYTLMALHAIGSLALLYLVQDHELCRWVTWFLLAAMLRRFVMKILTDAKLRSLLRLPQVVQRFAPLLRLVELPYFLKVHQLVVVALDNSSGGTGDMMAGTTTLVAMLVYSKLVADLWLLAKHAAGCLLGLVAAATRRARPHLTPRNGGYRY